MRKLKKLFVIIVAGVTSVSAVVSAQGTFIKGKDYEVTAVKTETEPMLEEFFNYACGACYSIETLVDDLKVKNPALKFRLIPVEIRPAWKIYVKAYYIGEYLNILEQSHSKIFHRIHVEKKPFKGEGDMKAFFLSLGVTEKDYADVASSYWLNTQMRLAKQYAFKHKIFGTPTFLVNKRFKLNNQELGTYQRIEEAIQHLSGLNKAEK